MVYKANAEENCLLNALQNIIQSVRAELSDLIEEVDQIFFPHLNMMHHIYLQHCHRQHSSV